MILCPNCETQNDDNARLCIECGFPLSGTVARGAGAISPSKTTAPYRRSASTPISAPISSQQHPTTDANKPYSTYVSDSYPQDAYREDAYRERSPHLSTHDFSWNEPLGSEDPAKALFEPTGSFSPVRSVNQDSIPSQQTNRIQTPQIIQVDVQGRELKLDDTQQMPVLSEDDLNTYNNDDYESPSFAYSDDHESPHFQDYSNLYQETARSSQPELLQDDFDSFYQDQTTLQVDTIKFDDSMRTSSPAPRSYSNNRRKDNKLQEKKRQPHQRNYRIPQNKKGMSGKQRGLVIGGAVLVVAALVFVVGFAFGIWGGVPVPNVTNMSQAEAVKILEENGFTTKVVQVKSDEIEGRVLATDPKAGSFAEEGSEIIIQITVARTIPDVVGKSLDDAKQILEESGYTNIKIQTEKSSGIEDIVLSSTPTADTRAKSTMEITLVVSENYKVPDISNLSYDDAVKAIQDAGLSSTVVYIDTDQYPDGTIIGTDPSAGTKVAEGTIVAINIARLRGVELNALATQLLSSGNTVNVAGVNYQVESLTSLSYQGNDVVSFTIQARPYVELFGETLFASSTQTVTGSIQYDSNNNVASIY